ncbi:hypothetical protein LX32DRAFT_655410 [Colletotrichum zoysiae]|uniref:Uncharacterized protein n=1 Tax=Colletotrichum zoysiae TaxID=1216348 RepID=A0AAD9HCL3_9PEZI|nr:hypothetical protein LX32DRAFT_655410 [Colletotrichum zoysiae]
MAVALHWPSYHLLLDAWFHIPLEPLLAMLGAQVKGVDPFDMHEMLARSRRERLAARFGPLMKSNGQQRMQDRMRYIPDHVNRARVNLSTKWQVIECCNLAEYQRCISKSPGDSTICRSTWDCVQIPRRWDIGACNPLRLRRGNNVPRLMVQHELDNLRTPRPMNKPKLVEPGGSRADGGRAAAGIVAVFSGPRCHDWRTRLADFVVRRLCFCFRNRPSTQKVL